MDRTRTRLLLNAFGLGLLLFAFLWGVGYLGLTRHRDPAPPTSTEQPRTMLSFKDAPVIPVQGKPRDVWMLGPEKSVVYYSFDGTRYVENPFMTITGLTEPQAIMVRPDGTIVVRDGGRERTFGFDGKTLREVLP